MAGLSFNIYGNDVSASKALHGVEKQAEGSTKKIGASFKKMAGIAAGALAGAGAVDFLKGAIDEATEAQKVGAQTTAVLKSTGGAAGITATQIGNLSTAISNKAGIDDEAIQSGANLLLTFTNLKNGVGKGNDIFNQTTQIMTDMSVATGTSMKSSAIQLGKALNDPIKGVSKLSKVGVTFTDGQKKQITALVKSGKSMQAQKVILKELNKEFGGSAAAQATPAEKASVAWGNLQEQIGGYLLPVIAKLSNFITTRVIPAISQMVSWVVKHKQGFIDLGRTIVTIAIAAYNNLIRPIANILIPIVKSIIGWIRQHQEGLKQLAGVIAAVVVGAFRLAIFWIKLFISVVRTTIGVVVWVAQKVGWAFGKIGDGVSAAWRVVGRVFGWIKDGISGVYRFVHRIVGSISGAFRGIGNGLTWAWNNTIGRVFGLIMSAIQQVKDAYNWLFGSGKARGLAALPSNIPTGSNLGGLPKMYGLPHNAQGSGFFGGGWTKINEQGSEIVHLPRGSRIDTASMSGSRLGGGGGNITINVKVDGALNTTKEIERAVTSAVTRGLNSGQRISAPRGAITVS